MRTSIQTAHDLVRQLLAGDQAETASLHLSMLLEKSSPLRREEDIYKWIMPADLLGLQLSPEESAEIISVICNELSRNPTEALIAAVSFTGADLPVQTAIRVLIDPPRTLSLGEVCGIVALIRKFLRPCLSRNQEFMPKSIMLALASMAEQLETIEETGTGVDRSARICIRMHAAAISGDLSIFGLRSGEPNEQAALD